MYKNYILLLTSLIIFFIGNGCKKEVSSIGANVQPAGDVTKTFFIETAVDAYTYKEDSTTTDERTLNLLGSYFDPVFGLSTASFITQFRMPSNTYLGSNPQVDSLILCLKYSGSYGNDFTTPQNIIVYKLIKDIYHDSTYYSNRNVNDLYNSSDSVLANVTFYPTTSDSIIRIKLSSSFANYIAQDSLALSSSENFINYFKGLYIKASDVNSGGSILYFNLLSPSTKLTLHYKKAGTTDTTSYKFVVNNNCARFNLFNHDFSSTSFYSNLNNETQLDSSVYIQSMGGLKVKVKFPDINNIRNLGNIAINKAELIIKNDISDNITNYPIPTQLIALMPNSSGKYEFLPDYNAGISYFDGNYKSDINAYKFNITLYIQKVINNTFADTTSASCIYLFTSGDRVSANRAVLYGGRNANSMKLRITYTKL